MRRRWPLIVTYVVAVLFQAGVLGAAYWIHLLSNEKMMVMRYFVAKNLQLEVSWFAPAAVLAQIGGFLAIGVVLAVATVLTAYRRAWFAAAQALTGGLLASMGAWLAVTQTAEDIYALYALIAAVWVVLVIEIAVVIVAMVRASRRRSATAGSSAIVGG